MRKQLGYYLLAASMSIIMCSCDSHSNDGIEPTPDPVPDTPQQMEPTPYTAIPVSDDAKVVTDLANGFALELYKTIAEPADAAVGNLCISPYSLFISLSMTANGDNGATRDELLRILSAGKCNEPDILNSYNRTLLEYLPSVDNLTACRIVNSVWYNPKYSIVPDFAETAMESYHASVFAESPAGKEGMERINDWVASNTGGLMPQLVTKPKDWCIAMVNAASFKGSWAVEFDEELSEKGKFANYDKSVGDATFMSMTGMLRYAKTGDAQVIQLDYSNGNYAMDIVLPYKSMDFRTFVTTLDCQKITDALSSFDLEKVSLRLPKFNTGCHNDNMLGLIKRMGLNSTVLNHALTGTDFPVEMTDLIHATNLSVDEKGSLAYAASLIGGMETDPGPESVPGTITINFDRPFLYLIRETSTGTILFIGQQTHF